MFDLIMFGTGFWFWSIVATWLLLEFIFTWNEYYTGATITMAAVFVVIWATAKSTFAPFTYVYENPQVVLIIAASYLLIGIIWSIFKWWFKLKKWKMEYDEAKKDFLVSHRIEGFTVPTELQKKFKEHVERALHCSGLGARVPSPGYYKDKIIGWIAYWPISMLCTFLGDFIVDVAKMLYNKLSFVYEGLTRRVTESIKKDIGENEEED